MNKFSVLKLGDKIQFEQEPSAIEELIQSGYKKISEVEADSVGDARYKYSYKGDHKKAATVNTTQASSPTGYLKFTSTLFFVLSIIGCLILVFLGIEASDSYGNRRFELIYFVSAFAGLLIATLVHSVCKTLIFIASNEKNQQN